MTRARRNDSNNRAARREFVQTAMGALAVSGLAASGGVYAAGNETIKVGLIGCGSRGTDAALNAMNAHPSVRIVALADLFKVRLKGSQAHLEKMNKAQTDINPEHCFDDFDAFKKLVKLDLDYVILATPPHFRPEHLAAAIEAGKNVFMEKPVAVDAPGCRSVMHSGDLAKEKGLSIVAGTQRRHEQCYLDALKRIQDGQIGKIVAARCYWNQAQLWHKKRESGWNDMEWMIRDWVNWAWLSGDHIVEQHVHNIDVINWFTGKHPILAVGMGGRAHRPTGDQYDYFSVDFEYEDGMHCSSYCRQVNECANNVSEFLVGDKGWCFTNSGQAHVKGTSEWRHRQMRGQKKVSPYVQEHIDLIESIMNKKGLNEAHNIATSTLTAVMGRTSAYTGRAVTWDQMMKDESRLGPSTYDWKVSLPPAKPPVAGLS